MTPEILRIDTRAMNRRHFTASAALAGASLALWRVEPSVARQVDLASLGYPTLDVNITADSFEGIPDTLEAGRYLLNATAEDTEEGGAISFLSPFGMSADEFLSFMMGGPPPDASPAAEPAPEGEEGGDAEGPLPTFIYLSKFAGGVFAANSMTGTAVIDLTEGEWIAWGDDPEAAQPPVIVTVTGEFPADVAEPEADVMATLVDFGITVEGNLTAGDHILRVENQGAQPHFLEIEMVPEGTTNDDLTAVIESLMTGTPIAGGLSDEDFVDAAYTPTQSIGSVTWTKVTLEVGTYSAVCFFPTAGIGDPHAFHGMHTVFEVS